MTPTRAGGVTSTDSLKRPAWSPRVSTDASKSWAVDERDSRGPRTNTVTSPGTISVEPPSRERTGIPTMAHSIGAAVTFTVTWVLAGDRSRTEGSVTPMLTDSVTVPVAPATDTGSVIAPLSRATALEGPTTSTVAGSAFTVPTTHPPPGSPSTPGTIGTTLVAAGSNAIETLMEDAGPQRVEVKLDVGEFGHAACLRLIGVNRWPTARSGARPNRSDAARN